MKVFLTGGTGFIGSYIAMALVREGHLVTILARNRNKIPALPCVKGMEIVQGDLADLKCLEQMVVRQDACIHVALNYAKREGWEVLSDDTLPTVFLAGASAQAGLKHFIYTSSTAVNDFVYMVEENKVKGPVTNVESTSKQQPTTFYGAAKAAAENFLLAQSYNSPMLVNFVRPGYTFGNPAIHGGSTQGDTRFRTIVRSALRGEPVRVIKNDGTQFIWAGDLAKLYLAILGSAVNRKTYFGLSKRFISWEKIAQEAIRRCNSKSPIEIEDRGWRDDGPFFDVSDMKHDFGLEFDGWDKICEHLDYIIDLESRTGERSS